MRLPLALLTLLAVLPACGLEAADSDDGLVAGKADDLCPGLVPPCQTDAECGTGMVCAVDPDPDACNPSACGCDPTTGQAICTADCGGKICQAAPTPDLCADFVPPCTSDADCGAGETCGVVEDACNPSACGCDPTTGQTICTADCGGKVCRGAPPAMLCADAGDCLEQNGPPLIECVGAHWECDPDGTCNERC
jgi:Cys-rich repeat protein